jgi:glutamine synthetase adenylyltransferase
MLDVYFAMRFLQLRDNIPDSTDDRSTRNMLGVLRDRGSLSEADYDSLFTGYRFLAVLDHELRLAVGRTTRLPEANVKALDAIASRMKLSSAAELIEQLTLHRLNIRSAFENVVGQ